MKYLTVLCILAFIIGCDNKPASKQAADTAKSPHGNVFEYGIYSAKRNGRILENTNTNTGKVVSKPVLELSEQTNRVPLIKNTYFAYRYRLLDLPKKVVKKPVVELRKVLIHPEMTLPNGTKSTGWDRTFRGRTSISQVIAFDGYVFNEDYELVEGDWTFQIWYKDQKLVEQVFTTYKADKIVNEKKTNNLKTASLESQNKI